MRHKGRVAEWNDKRGFGFIAPNGGGPKVFLHISAVSEQGVRPSAGNLVTYEIGIAADGRFRADSVSILGSESTRRQGSSRPFGALTFGVVLVGLAYVVWVQLSQPNTTITASAYKIVFAREALRPNASYQCAPEKSSCSAMTSCAEAFFHQERCGISNMDGDRDGIPCESQWCN